MSGVSVDVGGGPTQVDLDVSAIYQGGQNFLARFQALSQLKTEQELAYTNLRVGQDARAALDDAQRKQTEAGSKLDEANRTLAQAEQTAAETIRKARDQASAILESANQVAGTTTNEAAVLKSDAEQYATAKRKAADQSLKNAQAIEEESNSTRSELSAALASANAEKAAHLNAKAQAEFVYNKLAESINTAKDFHNKMAIDLMGILS